VVTRQLQVERRTAKVRRSEINVLPLSHATNLGCLQIQPNKFPVHFRTHFNKIPHCTQWRLCARVYPMYFARPDLVYYIIRQGR